MTNFETQMRRDAVVPPRVSVVIPSYNHESFVGETIRSVLSQSYQDLELIVIDDGSSDSSVEVIRKTIEEYPDSNVLFIGRPNKGLCKTLNEGLQIAKGEFFSYVGSDDLWLPEKLELQVDALLKAGAEYGACFTDCLYIDEAGDVIGKFSELYNYRDGDIYEDLVWNRFVPHSPTNLFYRFAVLEAGGFNEAHLIEDRDLWVRLSRQYKVVYVDEPLASWRAHGTNTGRDLKKMYDNGAAILDGVFERDPSFRRFENPLRASLDASHSYSCFAAGFSGEARRFALQSIRRNPFRILPWRVLLSASAPDNAISLIRSLRRSRKSTR